MEAMKTAMTVEEYLVASETWEIKHEWMDGQVWAMSGASMRHNAVSANLIVAVTLALRGRPCRATTSDQRVRVDEDTYLYPDLVVVCGRFQASERDSHSLVNPALIVEVLSPSTLDYDLGRKLQRYLRMPSVQDVLMVDPDTPHVVHYARTAEGWLRRDIREGAVHPTGLEGVALPLDSIYADLDALPAEDS